MNKQISQMRVFCTRLTALHPHNAFFLLKNCLCIPKLQYLLRTTPCLRFAEELHNFDDVIRDTLAKLLNVDMNDTQWHQASLPVRKGGMGVRRASDIAPSAYISSYTSTAELRRAILPTGVDHIGNAHLTLAAEIWSEKCNGKVVRTDIPQQQSALDADISESAYTLLLAQATTPIETARLVACVSKDAGSMPSRTATWVSSYYLSSCE
jgi:hypothetical protein